MRLQELGYLTLQPQGRPWKILTITDAGHEFCRRRVLPVLSAEEESFMDLTPQEQEQMILTTEKHLRLFRQRFAENTESSEKE